MSFPGRWWRNNDRNGGINFYSIMMKQNQLQINKRMQGKCSKLPQNCLSYSMVTCAQLAIVQWSHVTWLFLPGNTCSNHCDVKTRFVTLNFSHTLHKNNWQNTHHNSWLTVQDWSKCFDKIISEKYTLFTRVELTDWNTPRLFLMFYIHLHLLSIAFWKLWFNLTMESFKSSCIWKHPLFWLMILF